MGTEVSIVASGFKIRQAVTERRSEKVVLMGVSSPKRFFPRFLVGLLGAMLLSSAALYPQHVTNDSTAVDSLHLPSKAGKIEPSLRDLPAYRLSKDTITLKGGLHPDTVKAVPDTTLSNDTGKKRLIAGIVVASIVLIYVIVAIGFQGVGKALR
jgi:hypothetical protein